MTFDILLPVGAALLASVAMLAFMFGLRRILRRDVKVETRLSTYLENSSGLVLDPDQASEGPLIVERLNAAMVKILVSPDIVRKLSEVGFEVASSTPEAFGTFIQSEIVKLGKLVRASGAKLD